MANKNNHKEKNNKKEENVEFTAQLKTETKKTIIGIICLGVAILFILSFFRLAGPFGYFLYDTFYYLFGWVYFSYRLF